MRKAPVMTVVSVVWAMHVMPGELAHGESRQCAAELAAELFDLSPAIAAQFGRSVAVDAGTAVVGAPNAGPLGLASGSASIVEVRGTRDWGIQATLAASDGGSGDLFGFSVAINGDTAVVGAPGDDVLGTDSGAAYVFVREDGMWLEQAKLVPLLGESRDWFGFSVAIDGDWIVVGAPRANHPFVGTVGSGAAFAFKRTGTTWNPHWFFLASDGETNDEFGFSVSIDSETAAIGARYEWEQGAHVLSGATYLFVRDGSTWVQQTKLIAPNVVDDYGQFGFTVSLDGDTLAVCEPLADEPSERLYNIGAVHMFERTDTTWNWMATLTSSSATPHGDGLGGCSLDLSDDQLAFGLAEGHDSAGVPVGYAALFQLVDSGWVEIGTLDPDGASIHEAFGYAVGVNGNSVLVGAVGDDDAPGCPSGSCQSGSLYVFDIICERTCTADLDADEIVDGFDLAMLIGDWGDCQRLDAVCKSDLDGDGIVGGFDLARLLSAWGNCTGL